MRKPIAPSRPYGTQQAANAYCINEKKAIKLLETFEYKPKKMPKG